ncbi:MAG: hypothetical protein COA57_15790 [Flavobacteriales bacterium]|nr:MAG: hypothetical protein COA57_15790 [Flavobacteriales bacterium]
MTNKKFDLKNHGDAVEKDKYDLIEGILPNYKDFWSKYIGHDLKGNICPSNIQVKKIEEKRKYIGQLFYSIMTLLIELDTIKKEILEIDNIDNTTDYLKLRKSLRNFLNTFGQIFDKEMKILNQVFDNDKRKKRQEITETIYKGIRNFEQHSSDIPIIIEDDLVVIPNTFFLTDNDQQSWFEPIHQKGVVFLTDFVDETYKSLKNQVNNNIDIVKNKFKELAPDFKFNYPDFDQQHENIPFSAVTETYNFVTGISQEDRRKKIKNVS